MSKWGAQKKQKSHTVVVRGEKTEEHREKETEIWHNTVNKSVKINY